MTKFVIIDLSNLFHRIRFVVQGDAFTKAGMAMHILFKSLKKLRRELGADHFVFCVDGGSWRHEIFPMYKAKRKMDRLSMKPMEKEEMAILEDALAQVIDFIRDKTSCTVLQKTRIEADDFVARWIQNHPDDEHIIVSSDSDFVQLISENVSIYDAIKDVVLSPEGVTDKTGNKCEFSVEKASGRIKIKEAKEDFVAEDEWWKKALFIKCIRGDSGDGIFSCAPGASFLGTSKRTGIAQAWEDRKSKGYFWNNFMQTTHMRIVREAEKKEMITVAEGYEFNRKLIDLTMQPSHVKEMMDETIVEEILRDPRPKAGIPFMRFCNAHELPDLQKEASEHAEYLNAAYPRKSE